MLLRLIPTAPHPTILFNLTFPALPPPLPFPASWSDQLSLALAHNLPPPPSGHALDRACCAVELLAAVVFDVPQETVECRFVDGSVILMPLSAELEEALSRVVQDVVRSGTEAERERSSSPSPFSSGSTTPSPSPSPTPPGPLPSPSLLSLLSSFLPSFSASPDAEPHLRPRTPQPTSRMLRRTARSRLVDAYARFVQPELAAHLYKGAGGWAAWLTHGELRAARTELDELVGPSSSSSPNTPALTTSSPSPSTSDSPFPFAELPPTPSLSTSPTSTSRTSSASSARFPPPLSPAQLAAYTRLTTRVDELRGVLATLDEREREWQDSEPACKRRRVTQRSPLGAASFGPSFDGDEPPPLPPRTRLPAIRPTPLLLPSPTPPPKLARAPPFRKPAPGHETDDHDQREMDLDRATAIVAGLGLL